MRKRGVTRSMWEPVLTTDITGGEVANLTMQPAPSISNTSQRLDLAAMFYRMNPNLHRWFLTNSSYFTVAYGIYWNQALNAIIRGVSYPTSSPVLTHNSEEALIGHLVKTTLIP